MNIVTSKYARFENFLPIEVNQSLMEFTLNHESYFIQRPTSPDYPAQYAFGAPNGFTAWKFVILKQVKLCLPQVFKALDLKPFDVGEIETDVSSYPDMGYLATHNDTFCANTRVLSFVYYYQNFEKSFSGGQLALYDSEVDCFLNTQKANSCHLIEPENNTCVFFPSRCWHEVLPVACDFKSFPNNYFSGGRFSINGWIHKAFN
ncbi:hypothetical protein CAL7716_023850 [Calothrix sp. PCC 7716]|nr:hypothetical protein CAL7716_023850 [Calothrix sp. PCC 7716]